MTTNPISNSPIEVAKRVLRGWKRMSKRSQWIYGCAGVFIVLLIIGGVGAPGKKDSKHSDTAPQVKARVAADTTAIKESSPPPTLADLVKHHALDAVHRGLSGDSLVAVSCNAAKQCRVGEHITVFDAPNAETEKAVGDMLDKVFKHTDAARVTVTLTADTQDSLGNTTKNQPVLKVVATPGEWRKVTWVNIRDDDRLRPNIKTIVSVYDPLIATLIGNG